MAHTFAAIIGAAELPNHQTNTKPVDPRKIFLLAEQFNRGALLILKELSPAPQGKFSLRGDDPYKIAPVIAMCAFSFELHLKCLLVLDGKKPSLSHDLSDLYGQLSENRRNEIERRYEKERQASATAVGSDFVIERVLKRSANAFESHRYIYEFEDPREVDSWTCQVLANTVRGIIAELHPEWQR